MSIQTITKLNAEVQEYLEEYRGWVMSGPTQHSIHQRLLRPDSRMHPESFEGESCSIQYLMQIDHESHAGYPANWRGADLNYTTVQNESAQYESSFFSEIRRQSNILDDDMQSLLGARFCGLKAFYPENGFISWHTNWNNSYYVMIFSHSLKGNGYWRHIDPSGAKSVVPNPERMVHVNDVLGWHCKAGYFGSKKKTDRLIWHCAYTKGPRLTVSYLIPDEGIFQNAVSEISG